MFINFFVLKLEETFLLECVFRPSRLTQGVTGSSLRYPRTSATPLKTPMRTPNRSSSKDRQTLVPMTAEKEKAPVDDKLFVQGKTMQVLDELSRIGGFDELVQKGLKSMTHKHFISILQHFFKPIVGNTLLDPTNYVDYVYNFVQNMEYPYTINKSSLKTPSAPHCQNSIIILLAWLSEFTLKDTEQEPLIEYSTDDFESPAISESFMNRVSVAFDLWNNQQEVESEEVMADIQRMYIQKTTENCGDLDADIKRLRAEVDQLRKEYKPLNPANDPQYEKREHLKQLNEKIKELTKSTEELSNKISYMRDNLELKQVDYAKAEQELEALKRKLSTQTMSLEDRSKVLIEISQARAICDANKQKALELSESNSEHEIQLSKLIQKKFELIGSLNNLLYIVSSELKIAKVQIDFDPAAYEIKSTKTGDDAALDAEVEKIKRGLGILKKKYDDAMANFDRQIQEIQQELPATMTRKQSLLADLATTKKKIEEMSVEEQKLLSELVQSKQSVNELVSKLDADIKEAETEIRHFERNIACYEEKNPQLEASIETFKVKSLESIKSLHEARKQELEAHRKQVAVMKRVVEEYKKRQKPFPENVMKTISEVMAKRADKENIENHQH